MPVRRFRSVEAIPPVAQYPSGAPALFRAIGATWDLARRTNPRRFPSGVRRFRSFDEMVRAQEEQDVQACRELRDARTRRGV